MKKRQISECEFQSNGAPVPEERCAHSNANGVAVPFQTARSAAHLF